MKTAEKLEHLIKKYKPFITSFEKIGNNLASGIVEEFIKDIKSLQDTTEEREVKTVEDGGYIGGDCKCGTFVLSPHRYCQRCGAKIKRVY